MTDLELLDILDVVDDTDYIDNVLNKLEEKNIPLERYSQGVGRVNKYGTKLLELCKRCNLMLLFCLPCSIPVPGADPGGAPGAPP